MAVEDDPTLLEDEAPDEIEIEDDEVLDDEDQGNADEDEEELAGAADGERTEAPQGQTREVRQPSRAERRVEAALKEAREAKAEVERLRAERAAPQQPTETAAQRAERLAMMDPDQRVEFLLAEQGQKFGNELAQIRFQTADSADRTAFEGLCARNPVAAKLKDQVEDYLAQMRRTGTNAPRDTVLKYVIGDRALANAGRANGKASRKAADNVTRQTARVVSARSDQGASRGAANDAEARRKRLEDMQI